MGRWLIRMIAAAIVVSGLAVSARAATGAGEIRVGLDFADGEVHGGSVRLFRVGVREEDHYRLTNTFGGGLVKLEDARSPALALWLQEAAQEKGIPRLLDADGTACFTGLLEGLYLLVQNEPMEGIDPFDPILLELPWEGTDRIAVYPQYRMVVAQCPQTGDTGNVLAGLLGMLLSGMGLMASYVCLKRK